MSFEASVDDRRRMISDGPTSNDHNNTTWIEPMAQVSQNISVQNWEERAGCFTLFVFLGVMCYCS